MNNKDFDDSIRRRIENANIEEISSEKIEKVISYVSLKRSEVRKKKKLYYLATFFLITCILGLFSWNIVQLQEKEALLYKIDSITKNQKVQFAKMIVNNDTISKNTNQNTFFQNNKTEKRQHKINTILASSFPKSVQAIKKNNSENNTNNLNQNLNRNSYAHDKNDSIKLELNKEAILINNDSSLYQYSRKTNEDLDNKIKEDTVNSTMPLISSISKTNGIDSSNSSTQEEQKKTRNIFNFKFQFGIGTDHANGQSGIGFFSNLKITNALSFGTGIKKSIIGKEKFRDEVEFRNKKEKDIRYIYSNQINDSDKIADIGIRNSVIQIPIQFQYNLSINSTLKLAFALGTDIDLMSKQELRYKKIDNIRYEESRPIHVKSNVIAFNNAYISIGLEKEIKKFTLQIAPFIAPQITKVSYRNEAVYYGIKARIFYTI